MIRLDPEETLFNLLEARPQPPKQQQERPEQIRLETNGQWTTVYYRLPTLETYTELSRVAALLLHDEKFKTDYLKLMQDFAKRIHPLSPLD